MTLSAESVEQAFLSPGTAREVIEGVSPGEGVVFENGRAIHDDKMEYLKTGVSTNTRKNERKCNNFWGEGVSTKVRFPEHLAMWEEQRNARKSSISVPADHSTTYSERCEKKSENVKVIQTPAFFTRKNNIYPR
ncbi:MAG: hypothetical protein PHH49_06410 [Candidatus Omnitrophica bacterium]|nr:hypothetical protein [Candidatus Omnitrophota bacterium]MDD5488573.1 hypothetical protein [Candidatus Omnitrophota bacterium]